MIFKYGKKCVKDIKIVEIFNHSFWKKKMCENFVESNCSELPERDTMVGIAKFCQKNKCYFVTKIVVTYCEKNCSCDREKLLKNVAEGGKFAKINHLNNLVNQ